jgi:hypothetical protein
MPTRTVGGNSSKNTLAAACAALIRFGSTSFARMLSDTSIASITVC